ncbi:hypothetical protein BBP40_006799 [Aspergillus hancockii]|nr:hypothetical protein BBP40_006799 [Aspergillus hancockii]
MNVPSTFYRPYEGDPRHNGVIIMAWPGPENPNYAKPVISKLKSELSAIAKAISDYEPVMLLVNDKDLSDAETTFQSCGSQVEIKSTDMDDLEMWMRDVAPTFVFAERSSHSGLHGIDFNFNGWGGRYPSTNSAHLARQFLVDRSIPRVETPIVVEGGAIEADGEGTLLATEASIINPNRNPNVSREFIEQELRRLLGVSKIIWVPGMKDKDTTDGHVDAWVRFVAPGKVVLNDPGPGQHVLTEVYNTTKQILSQATDAKGRHLEIIDLPQAGTGGSEPIDPALSLNYVNYLLVTGAVIVPQFGDHQADDKAREILQALFPERKVVQVYIDQVAWNGSGVHCVTQEILGDRKRATGQCLCM